MDCVNSDPIIPHVSQNSSPHVSQYSYSDRAVPHTCLYARVRYTWRLLQRRWDRHAAVAAKQVFCYKYIYNYIYKYIYKYILHNQGSADHEPGCHLVETCPQPVRCVATCHVSPSPRASSSFSPRSSLTCLQVGRGKVLTDLQIIWHISSSLPPLNNTCVYLAF